MFHSNNIKIIKHFHQDQHINSILMSIRLDITKSIIAKQDKVIGYHCKKIHLSLSFFTIRKHLCYRMFVIMKKINDKTNNI